MTPDPEPSNAVPAAAAETISLSLCSHTNVGKTTLARTLLGRDVGEVRDAVHVTDSADAHTLLETGHGDRLLIWDTPGFGDSVRLARRMRQSGNPIGWLLTEVWDRWRDRPFWASQQALRNVREQADLVLYLVNASEEPEAAGYVAPEMELLAWVGRPVLVLLNQLGMPREREVEEAEVQRWRNHFATRPLVKAVLPLDAFARCWVQEGTLLRAIEQALEAPPRRAAMARLRERWAARRWATFDASMRVLAAGLVRAATTRQELPDVGGVRTRLREMGATLGFGDADETRMAIAQKALAADLETQVRADTRALIELHGLEGDAEGELLARLSNHYEWRLKVPEAKAAVWGGVVSGALVGLKADLLSGGLTLGGGLIAGSLLGALGAAGLARGVNLVRGTRQSWLTWSPAALNALAEAALLRYLMVAHFGRGRGEWVQGESPPHWAGVVGEALEAQREFLDALWRGRGDADDAERARLAEGLEVMLSAAAKAALRRLYPDAGVA